MCLFKKIRKKIRYFLFPLKLGTTGFDNYKDFFISWANLGVGVSYREDYIKKKLITTKYFKDLISKGYLIEDEKNNVTTQKYFFLSFSMYPIINLWEQEKINLRNEFNTKLIIKLTFFTIFVAILMGVFEATKYILKNNLDFNVTYSILLIIFLFIFLIYIVYYDKTIFVPPEDDDVDNFNENEPPIAKINL
jgi:membrane-associated HD superfamily phosphohydrolase